MSLAIRLVYTTAVSLTAVICLAAKAVSDEPTPLASADTRIPRNTSNSLKNSFAPDLSGAAKNLPNGGLVAPYLLRSAQPTDAQLAALKKAGVKTVINLRDGQKDIAHEKLAVEKLGMRSVSISMSSFKPVKDTDIDEFMRIVDDPKNRPVLVHCRQGEDRTGTMCAIYRMTRQGWTGPQAYREMINYGFHPQLLPLVQAVVEVSKSTAVPIAPPTFSDMTTDMKQRVDRFYNRKFGGTQFGGFTTNF